MTPSMKYGVYHVYILSAVEGEVCSIKKATCECAAAMFHLILIIILYLIAENL